MKLMTYILHGLNSPNRYIKRLKDRKSYKKNTFYAQKMLNTQGMDKIHNFQHTTVVTLNSNASSSRAIKAKKLHKSISKIKITRIFYICGYVKHSLWAKTGCNDKNDLLFPESQIQDWVSTQLVWFFEVSLQQHT